jgi:hypothetical protein
MANVKRNGALYAGTTSQPIPVSQSRLTAYAAIPPIFLPVS